MAPPTKGAAAPATSTKAGCDPAKAPEGSSRDSTPSMMGIRAMGSTANSGAARMKARGRSMLARTSAPKVISRTSASTGASGLMRLPM